MAIAWVYRREYEAAGLKILPDADSTGRLAGAQAVAAAAILIPVSLLPALTGLAGPNYLIGALVLSLGQLYCSIAFLLRRNDRTAHTLFRATLIYLPALLLWLAVSLIRH
jgi:protoheme IX farnesyltransferase